MIYIVNLSSVITYDLEKSKEAFITLCDKYSDWKWLSCCGSLFQGPQTRHQLNTAWVAMKYTLDLLSPHSIINNYKLGKLTTEQFLEEFNKMFSFLVKNENILNARESLAKKTGRFITIDPQDENLYNLANALLIQAWTAGIQITNADEAKINHYINLARNGEPVYFISNSNPLDIEEIIFQVNQINNAIEYEPHQEAIFSSNLEEEPIITMGENIHLCLSYRYGAFKTPSENKPFLGTPGLVQTLIAQLQEEGKDINEIKIISQYKKDLEVTPGIPKENLFLAEDYYREELEQYGIKQKVM